MKNISRIIAIIFSDEGNFDPEKWLEYRWTCEGVENRSNTNIKRKEKLKVEALEADTTILSPQRRAFSSGCRGASPAKNGNIFSIVHKLYLFLGVFMYFFY